MRFILTVIIILGIVDRFEGYVIVKVEVSNYKNDYNLKHDGYNCENFHFFGDHCDPIFHICIGSHSNCDLLNKKIGSWHNHKRISNVFSESLRLNFFPGSITVSVSVEDHDSFDANDHIGKFSTKFQIDRNNNVYEKSMSVYPYNYGVGLESKITLECFDHLHEKNCKERYELKQCRRLCRKGECKTDIMNEFYCQCQPGWSGIHCQEYYLGSCENLPCKKRCTKVYDFMECICIESGLYKMYCRENIKVIPETIPELLDPSTYSPRPETTLKLLESTMHNTTVSPLVKSTDALITETSKNFAFSTGSLRFKNETKQLHSTANPGKLIFLSKIHKAYQAVQYSPSTIIMICILILLCITILALIIVVRNGQKSRMSKLDKRRPLPPIVFQRDSKSIRPFKLILDNNSTKFRKTEDDYYESITSRQTSNKDVDYKLFSNHNVLPDIYEECLIHRMESLTYETEYNDSIGSDMYEVPVKHNLPIN